MNCLRRSLNAESGNTAIAVGQLLLRVFVGGMIFYIHGWHKLEGWIAYLHDGTPWKLAGEVAELHIPAPMASAVMATGVQFVCSLFLVAGFFTRLNSVLLVGVLGVAILQNVLAGRDPQLALLYTLVVTALTFVGGGYFSFDARLFKECERHEIHTP